MRKLFALVATVTMVLSMFAGIAFAATTDVDSIILSTTSKVMTGAGMQELVIHGQLVKADGTLATLTASTDLTVNKGTTTLGSTAPGTLTINNGTFTYREIVTDGKAANYTFTANGETAVFALKYDLQLTNRSDINFNLNDSQQEAVLGVLKYADGTLVEAETGNVQLCWDGGTLIGSSTSAVTSKGQFGLFTPATFAQAGKIALYVNGVKHTTGEVTAYSMTVAATPSSGVAHTVADSIIEMKLSNGPITTKPTTVVVKKGDTTVTTGYTLWTDAACTASPFASGDNLAFGIDGKATLYLKSDFSATAMKAGSYTVTVTADSQYKAVATISVVNPATYTLVDALGLLEDQVINTSAGHTITVGKTGNIQVVQYPNPTTGQPNLRYVVYVDGTQKLEFVDGAATTNSLNIATSGASSKSVRIVAYAQATGATTYNSKVFDKTYTINYKGWNVSHEVKTLILRQETEITFVVTDIDGNPINNATIQIENDNGTMVTFLNPITTSVSNGVYTAKVKYNSNVGPRYTRDITVSKTNADGSVGATMTSAVSALTVIGSPVYTVTANVDSLLNGLKQKVVLTANDGSSNFIPSAVYQQVGTAEPTSLGITPKADGTFEITVTPTDASKDITLRVENADGTKSGSIVLDVVKPQLVMEENEAVTENFNSYVEFKVVDPRNGNVLANQVDLLYGNYMTSTNVVVLDSAKNDAGNSSLLGSELHEIYFRIKDVDWDSAETDEKAVEVKLEIKLDATAAVAVDGTIPVKKATLTSNPETVILGQANNLVLTLADANGNGIAGKKIHLGTNNSGTVAGTTDANGQLVYATSSAVTFAAITDISGKYVTEEVIAGVDAAAPEVTVPATSDKNTATITITDNVRVIRVMINGVEDTTFFPGATYTKNVNLVAGVNTFTVQAMDNNYNTVSETVTITYTPATNDSTVLQGAAVERKGEFVFVQVRQFEELGATMTWNATTKTATFTAGGKTVAVTVGSTTAMVDGVAVTMPSAPYIVSGRTMVPTRFISEALGWNVQWAAGDIVTITLA